MARPESAEIRCRSSALGRADVGLVPGLAGGHRLGLARQLAGRDEVDPLVDERHLVPARAPGPEEGELRALPVALPVGLLVEGGLHEELVAVVAVAVEAVRRGAVAQRDRRDVLELGLQHVAAEAGRVPGDVDDAGHYAPTSARIAPGPSSVRPWPSASAPTRIAILPRCLFSCMSWWARATSSKGIVCHRTGRIWLVSMRWLALLHSHALAKCEPRISFWRIQRYLTSKSSW